MAVNQLGRWKSMAKKHLIACSCCGRRWIDSLGIAKACPWCGSSSVSLGELPAEAIKALVSGGMPDISQG
jgi:hypothetical protein